MIRSQFMLLTVGLVVVQMAGCSTIESWRSPDRKMTHSSKSEDQDASDDSDTDEEDEETEDPWKFVGDQGRAGMDREAIPDPWFGKHLYSQKARDIERNLGFDH
jgi:hypothetical protein